MTGVTPEDKLEFALAMALDEWKEKHPALSVARVEYSAGKWRIEVNHGQTQKK